MKPHNILYLTSDSSMYGGAERLLFELLQGLDRREYNPLVVTPRSGDLCDALRARNVETMTCGLGLPPSRREFYSARGVASILALSPAAIRLALLIRQRRIDLVHTNTSAIFAGALAARLSGKPHIWHVREMLFSSGWMRHSLRLTIPCLATKVICISNAVRRYFLPLPACLEQRLTVVFDGLDSAEFRSISRRVSRRQVEKLLGGLHESERLVGSVGRINPWKGQDTFMRAAGQVLRQHPNTRFVIVGGAMRVYVELEAKLKSLANELGIADRVIFLGIQPQHVVSAILQHLDVFVLPTSTSEGLGRVVLEAMAWGKPVVATDVGGPRDVVLDGITGYLVSPRDPVGMADAIGAILSSPDKARTMGEAGLDRVSSEFSSHRYVSSVSSIYDQLVSDRN